MVCREVEGRGGGCATRGPPQRPQKKRWVPVRSLPCVVCARVSACRSRSVAPTPPGEQGALSPRASRGRGAPRRWRASRAGGEKKRRRRHGACALHSTARRARTRFPLTPRIPFTLPRTHTPQALQSPRLGLHTQRVLRPTLPLHTPEKQTETSSDNGGDGRVRRQLRVDPQRRLRAYPVPGEDGGVAERCCWVCGA